jgi:hypothetical protein
MKTLLRIRYSINLPPFPEMLVLLAVGGLALSPMARAVTPAPDGGYPGSNTAEGDNALFNLAGGLDNTALGFDALLSNTAGNFNTAVGFEALFHNTTGFENTAIGVNALISNTTGSSLWLKVSNNVSAYRLRGVIIQ